MGATIKTNQQQQLSHLILKHWKPQKRTLSSSKGHDEMSRCDISSWSSLFTSITSMFPIIIKVQPQYDHVRQYCEPFTQIQGLVFITAFCQWPTSKNYTKSAKRKLKSHIIA